MVPTLSIAIDDEKQSVAAAVENALANLPRRVTLLPEIDAANNKKSDVKDDGGTSFAIGEQAAAEKQKDIQPRRVEYNRFGPMGVYQVYPPVASLPAASAEPMTDLALSAHHRNGPTLCYSGAGMIRVRELLGGARPPAPAQPLRVANM